MHGSDFFIVIEFLSNHSCARVDVLDVIKQQEVPKINTRTCSAFEKGIPAVHQKPLSSVDSFILQQQGYHHGGIWQTTGSNDCAHGTRMNNHPSLPGQSTAVRAG
jgi:hypothetical protein